MKYLRSQIGEAASDETLTNYLNSALPAETSKFTTDTVRRWARGIQKISRTKKAQLAAALGVKLNDLSDFLNGKTNITMLLPQIKRNEALPEPDQSVVVGQIFQMMLKLSPRHLAEVMSRAGEIMAEKLESLLVKAFTPTSSDKKTIAQLVQENKAACVRMFTQMIDLERVDAIATGAKPTLEELELLEHSLPVTWEELLEMYRKEFENGIAGKQIHSR